MSTNTPETAPRDGSAFIGNFGLGSQLATWNEPSKKWAVAVLDVGLFQGQWNDASFLVDWHDEDELIAWIPLPEIRHEPAA